jgi:hypothetical protein
LGERDGALVVLPDGGGFSDGGIEDLPHKLPEVESLLGGVSRKSSTRLHKWIGPHKSVI